MFGLKFGSVQKKKTGSIKAIPKLPLCLVLAHVEFEVSNSRQRGTFHREHAHEEFPYLLSTRRTAA